MEDLFQLALKASVASCVLMLVVLAGQRAGPVLAGIVMTYPFNVGVGSALMVLERPDQFMADAGVAGFALAGGVFAYLTGYSLASRRWSGFVRPWLVGIAAWFGVAVLALSVQMTWPLAVALAIGGALAAGLLIKRPPPTSVKPGENGKGSWAGSIARAVVGGTIIAAIAVYSKDLGPEISGMALAFPTMMSASLWILNRRFGDEFAGESVYRSRWALLSYTSFVLFMGLLAVPLGGVAAMAVSASIAALTSFLVFRVSRRN
ncbi:MAG: hypothetical protein ACKVGZ_12105 [Alphaproteobacteria bacterium]|jgi:uncharacterized membrane protein (GlpM family)